MKILSWNCRGLGKPRTVQSLCMLVKEQVPDMVFLMETKLFYGRALKVEERFRFEGVIVVESVGRSGALMIMWRQKERIVLVNYSQRHINVLVQEEGRRGKWLLTCFYGQPEARYRGEAWRLLSSFRPAEGGWGVIGDFNEVLTNDEKEGGNLRNEKQMGMFRRVLEDGNLSDLGWKGDKFTWCNQHEDDTFIKERLDRVVANPEWRAMFDAYRVETLPVVCSDHRPILLECLWSRCTVRSHHVFFKYEINSVKEEGCSEIVKTE
ncbi:uncharacterized protein LOC122274610 [Carya illinoinensis]|uniref:uncharacterized protein LOC122274610 n=1 Tax=Carya illinoinensis TaxID=32201 RepID=UPI001C71ACDF|nr:uncharacterized protein LOC122274610 [Carya illinoinensis]